MAKRNCANCTLRPKHTGDPSYCKPCRKAASDAWRKAHLPLLKERRWKQRLALLKHYGGRCVCCDETEPRFLSIDHIEGNGNSHRREIRASGWNFAFWLIKNNYPEGFQVLCMNCNFAKGMYGKCPHSERK